MSPEEFKSAIAKLGLSQERAGAFFGHAVRHGQRWALGESPLPVAETIALHLMIKHGYTPDDFKRLLAKRDEDMKALMKAGTWTPVKKPDRVKAKPRKKAA